ncbi:MAG: class I SAM-dependent methyltransferase [Bacteroidetes bacterium]|nr:class I SAM-dependent methyltransferase [Bacteroidota bacterium]
MLSVFSKFWPRAAAATPATPPAGVEQVRNFYNDHTDKFMQVYGEIIQAFRTNQVTDYLDYTIQSAELHDGQRILDAGCGVGGPASYFASRLQADITGVTISDYQVAKSREVLATKELKGTVTIRQGDYHDIDQLFGENVFDRVLFLESFGHSPDQNLLIEKAYKVLKPGGILYIKDLFRREHPNAEDGRRIDHIISAINQAYAYNVADFTGVMKTIRRLNFILIFVKTPEIRTEEFEHLTISNDFQNLFDIGKIISWEDYVFPIDFYEIKVMKPPFDVNKEKHLYFLNRPQ